MSEKTRRMRPKAGKGPFDWVSIGLRVPVKPTGRKFVLFCLTLHADEDGYCWPSRALLRQETSQSPNTLDGHLQALEAAGLIKVVKQREKGRWDDSAYQIDWEAVTRAALSEVDPCADPARRTGAAGRGDAAAPAGADHPQKLGTDHPQKLGTDHPQFSSSPSPVSENPPIPPYKDEGSIEEKAGTPAGDPDGPSDGPAEGEGDGIAGAGTSPEDSLAAAWRELLPRVQAALGREKPWLVEATFRDAFVDASHAGETWQDASPDGKLLYGDPLPVTRLKLAVPEAGQVARINGLWRREIVKATGVLLEAVVDRRAYAARERRLEREKAEREEARRAERAAKRRAARS